MLESVSAAIVLAADVEKTWGVPSTAFFGLLGVLIGAVIATVGDWTLERHRDERAEKAEKTANARNLKEAARLVDLELQDAEGVIGEAIFREEWWPAAREFSADVFTQHRATLAVQLSDAEWPSVSYAYIALNELNWNRRTVNLQIANGRGGEFDEDVIYALRDWVKSAFEARKALAPYSSTSDRELLESTTVESYVEENFRTAQEEYNNLRGFVDAHLGQAEPPTE